MDAEADFLQAERVLRIKSPLGTDVLLAQKLNWREGISELFEGRVSVRSKTPDLVPQDLLGKRVDVSLELGGGQWRVWNALVTGMTAGPRQSRGLRHYELTLRPDLWLLTQTSDCRIWLDRTALDVAEELLGEHGLAAPETGGVVDPVPRQHYSVQWNESDLAYLTRRLEEDGLYFWWSHETGSHRMHIASHAAGYVGGEDVRFAMGSTDRNHINRFETTFRYIPGSHARADWNFTTPGSVPGGTSPGLVSLPKNGNYERFEYPAQAGYGPGARASEGIEDAAVERVARLRMQAEEAEHARVEGASNVRTLAAGARFTPYDVANPDNVFDPHVILAIEHEVLDASYESVANQPEYLNRFLALPADVPATPRRTTPQPRIDGTQVAIVAGPAGEEIHPDEYGRIKLWFPWDRRAKRDGTDTCWVRVTQNWAGAGWGSQIIPRIGMEVMVSYLDGDPDRPVVTGVVPNARQKVPYGLPEHKTKSVFRTNSHKADYRGFNELSFEDLKGEEKIYLHAERDHELHIENNRAKRVDRNQSESVGFNKSIEVGNNHHEVIGGNMTLMVGPNKLQSAVTTAFQKFTGSIGALANRLGLPDAMNMGEGNLIIGVAKNKAETVMVSSSEIVGAAKAMTIGGGYQVTVGGIKNESVAVGSWEEVGNNKVVHVGEKFELICGKSKLTLDRDGNITLSGVKVHVDGSSNLALTGGRVDLN